MTHEFDGKKYEQASAHQKEWGTKLITELDLLGTERVLDLGCGDGAVSARIAELVPNGEVVGIDASRGMVEAARAKGRKNLRFLLMDINELNYSDEFDVVFSNATLHWIKDHKHLLRNVGRALRQGGRLRFNFAGEGNCSRFFLCHSQSHVGAGICGPLCRLRLALVHALRGGLLRFSACQRTEEWTCLGRKRGQVLSGRKGNDQVDRPAQPGAVSCTCSGKGQSRFPGVCDPENDSADKTGRRQVL